jgi:putative ABC transport system permease protein
MRDDLKAAYRSLRSSRTFTAVALLVLALGIGATTAIFSVVDAVVLRGLPFDEHDRLVAVGERLTPGVLATPPADPQYLMSIAPQNYRDWAERQDVFESMAAIASGPMTLLEPGAEPEDIRANRVTAAFFDVLRVRPALGAAFTSDAEVDGRHRVAVLSDALWRRRFGADPGIVGRTIPLDGAAYEVAGVMPPGFEYPVGLRLPIELWVPFVVPPADRTRVDGSRSSYLTSVARLKPGVSVSEAQAAMARVAAGLTAEHPVWNKDGLIGVRPLHDHVVGSVTRSWMVMLLGAVGIVLLIACANVANLMLARATAREREIGVRAALGASRWRLVRGLLAESLILSAAGSVLALVLAWWAVAVLKGAMPEGVARVAAIAIDARVFAASAALALLTGLLFGIVPALQLSRPNLVQALRDGGRGTSAGAARQRVRNLLVVAEVALAVVLLAGAALFIGSFRTLMKIDPGYDTSNVLAATVSLRFAPVAQDAPQPDGRATLQALVDRLAQVPGVTHAAAIGGGTPLTGSRSTGQFTVRGVTHAARESISIRRVTASYHDVMRIPLLEGRAIRDSDRQDAPQVAVVNAMAVDKYFGGRSPVGETVAVNGVARTVVGVMANVHQNDLETEPVAEVYLPLQQTRSTGVDILLRTSVPPYSVLPQVKAAALDVVPDTPLRQIRTLDEAMGRRVAQRRLNMLLLSLFGVLGLVISAAGIYGVMAYLVAQRTREIGIRMALGATRGAVVRLVLSRAAALVMAGLAAGTAAAWYLSAAAGAFLFRMETADPRAYAGAVAALAAAALVASLVPARRAASVEPVVALRAD